MPRTLPFLTLALTLALGLAQAVPVVAQRTTGDWIEVARRIGGSGVARGGRYVLLVPSHGWDDPTPPAWPEFRRESGASVARGTIPVLRGRAPAAVDALREELPGDADVLVSDTFGPDSQRVHVRFLARAAPVPIALGLRDAFERIEPGALARIDTTGVTEKDSFEGEDGFIIRTTCGERVDVGELPAALTREGVHVRMLARRRNAGHGRFLYYGGTGNWRTVATLERGQACPAPPEPRVTKRREDAEWLAACRRQARALLEGNGHEAARLDKPLASGFDRLDDPGSAVCPRCRRALAKHWLFAGAARDRVDASLRCCADDGLYFLGRDGFDHGPFFPDLERKDER